MIDFAAVLTASAVCLAAVMSPGPNFVAVTQRAVSAHRAEALALAGGVAVVSAAWAATAVFGLGVLFAVFPGLFLAAKRLGAAYLVWFGIRLWRLAGAPAPPTARNAPPSRSSLARAFRDGMVTNLSNPKSMAFYASVFSAAVPTGASLETQLALVAMVGLVAAGWYGAVALALSADAAAAFHRRGRAIIERVCSTLLVAFGLRLAYTSA